MPIIDADGLFNGERLAAVSDEAKYAWPFLWCASNTVGRLELHYHRIIARAFPHFQKPPTEPDLWRWINEYWTAYLLFVYRAPNGSTWGQWDTSEKFLQRHKLAKDLQSPAPDPKAFTEWREEYIRAKAAKSALTISGINNFVNPSETFCRNVRGVGIGVGVGSGSPPPALRAPTVEPPVSPLQGEAFTLSESENGNRQAAQKRSRKGKRESPAMTEWQREGFRQFLALHPKNTIQVVSATALWTEKVTDEAVKVFLMDCLRRETKGDATYMLGPAKWLKDHLELYAAGVQPKAAVQAQSQPPDRYALRKQRENEVFEDLVTERINRE